MPAVSEPEVDEPPEAAPDDDPAPPPADPPVAAWSYLRDARRHVAHTYRAEIQGCFDASFARGGTPRGRVVLAMVPHPDGRVAASRILENETGDVDIGDCLVLEARAWALPTPPRRTLEVQLRFIL